MLLVVCFFYMDDGCGWLFADGCLSVHVIVCLFSETCYLFVDGCLSVHVRLVGAMEQTRSACKDARTTGVGQTNTSKQNDAGIGAAVQNSRGYT